jgi:hypothetical protein
MTPSSIRTLAAAAVAVYVASCLLGRCLHRLNEALAALAIRLTALEAPPKPTETPKPVLPQSISPISAPVASPINVGGVAAPFHEPTIRTLHAAGLSQRQIASELGITRHRVRVALRG